MALGPAIHPVDDPAYELRIASPRCVGVGDFDVPNVRAAYNRGSRPSHGSPEACDNWKMKKPPKLVTTHLIEHPSVQAWSRLAPLRVEPERIEILKRKEKGSVFRLGGVGAGDGDVIAKRCHLEKARVERFVYEQVLPKLPTSPLDYYGSVPDEDPRFAWLFMEDCRGEPYSSRRKGHRAVAARWLGLLHTTAASIQAPSGVPDRGLGHHRGHLDAIGPALSPLRNLASVREYGDGVLDRIEGLRERLAVSWEALEQLCADVPQTVTHGDCLPRNFHIRANGDGLRAAPFDWGGAGLGPATTDLGQLALPRPGRQGPEPDHAAYGDSIRECWPDLDLERIRQLANLGQIFWGLKVIRRGLEEFDHDWHSHELVLDNLKIYESALARSVARIGDTP